MKRSTSMFHYGTWKLCFGWPYSELPMLYVSFRTLIFSATVGYVSICEYNYMQSCGLRCRCLNCVDCCSRFYWNREFLRKAWRQWNHVSHFYVATIHSKQQAAGGWQNTTDTTSVTSPQLSHLPIVKNHTCLWLSPYLHLRITILVYHDHHIWHLNHHVR